MPLGLCAGKLKISWVSEFEWDLERTEGKMDSVVFDFKVRLNVQNAELETFFIQSRRRSGDVITRPVLLRFCIYLAINFMQSVKPKNESPVTGK